MHASFPNGELDDLFDRLPVALYRTSADGEVLAANQATADLLGYETAEELLTLDQAAEFSHVDPAEREEWRRTIEEDGVVQDFAIRLRRKDGTMLWVRDTARAVYDDDNNVRFYEGALVDISEEVRASVSSSVLSEVLESTTDYVVVFDGDGRLRYANSAVRSFLDLSEDLVRSRPEFSDLIPELDFTEALEATTSRGWSGEVTLPDRQGKPCPLWAVVTRHDERDQTYLAAIVRDLTQVKRTQRRLEELLTAKDVFVATVSHELRNPLTGVMGLAEELRDGFEDFGDQERHDLITLIAHQAAEMTGLVEDLLVAIRSDVNEVAVVPEQMDVVSQLTELSASHAVKADWHLPDASLPAWADPQRFRQIMRNLLSNADRHGGSTIRVTVESVDSRITVRVSDNGGGVPPEDVERIFEPYQRADGSEVKKGSVGLGLSVARRLARLMGGDLDYIQEGEWATFRLTVPTQSVPVETIGNR